LQTAWRVAYSVESLGEHDTPEVWSDCRAQVERLIASRQAWILEEGSRPVATSALNSTFEDLVQIGGVYTPPALRSRGYGRAVVAGSLLDLEAEGVRQAILFTGDANLSAQKAYLALGFQRIGDFRMILLREGFWPRRAAASGQTEMAPERLRPLRFIAEPIEVEFDQPPVFAKRPGCPDRFTWEGRAFQVVEMLREWQDTGRRGRMASNMRPEHLATASQRGSWGVGRIYFRVRTDGGRVFDLYFDRAPKHAGDRLGHWFLFRELG
jgi:N-acetylglutamate synthase-like GNAT family acetyltransferase